MTPETWRLLPYDIGPSEQHFRLSDALVRAGGGPTIWWHSADRPTLILGAGQTLAQVNEAEAVQRGVRVVRRQAGGTAVFADAGVLGLDVSLPPDHPLAAADIVESYRWLGSVWLDSLTRLGVSARLIDIAEARSGSAAGSPHLEAVRLACFGSLSPFEVAVGPRKLVGFAQVRRRTGTLWQAAIHLRFEAESLAVLLPGRDPDRTARALKDVAVGLLDVTPMPVSVQDVMGAFAGSLHRSLGVDLQEGNWTEEEQALADRPA